MEDLYSIYVIIALSVFLLWFFFGGCCGVKLTESKTPNKPNNIVRPRDGVYKESRVDRVRRRLKARF